MTGYQRVAAFDVAEYVAAVRSGGRRALDADLRAHAVSTYRAARTARLDPELAVEHIRVARLAEAVLSAEWELSQRGGKRYVAYANIRTWNWVLGTDRRRPVAAITRRCHRALECTVASWWGFERRSEAGAEDWNQGEVIRERLAGRIDLLAQLADRLGIALGDVPPVGMAPPSWHDYAEDPRLVVEFLTALPQTTHHDEVAFLRTIHVSESCFWGMLVSVMAAVESLKRGADDLAAGALDQAVPFADTLGLALQVLQTMAPGAFLDFGGLTGDASGLQSRAYQLLQIFVFGVDAEKVTILGLIPELRDLLFYANPRFVPLGRALRQAQGQGQAVGTVMAAARRLDAAMYQWRARHKGVATHYLPDDVLTGAAGRDYLASHYRHRLFAPDGRLEKAQGDLLVRPVEGIHARPLLTPAN